MDSGRKYNQGEANPMSKLTASQIADIRARWQAKRATETQLAKEYGVTQPAISLIVHDLRQ